MTTATNTRWITGLCAAVVFAGLACGAALLVPTPAEARVFVGVGFGFPIGFPGYYYPPYPYPYYYRRRHITRFRPTIRLPAHIRRQPLRRRAGIRPRRAPQAPPITYTPRWPWTDASGRQCREYQTTRDVQGRPTKVYGTACRDPDGQWRVVN